MKALALLLLRLVTGLYLLAWSVVKLTGTERAIEISDKLYFGLLDNPVLQHALGALGGVLGLFVILGFLRSFSYLVQALVLALGVGALAKTFAMPTDVASGVEMAIALTPYLALFVAALVPLLAKPNDIVSLDAFLAWAERRLARDEMAVPAVTAAAAAAAVIADEVAHAEAPAHDDPHDTHDAGHEVEALPEHSVIEEASVEAPVEEVAEEAAPHDEPAASVEEAAVEAAPQAEAAEVVEEPAAEIAADEGPAVETHADEEPVEIAAAEPEASFDAAVGEEPVEQIPELVAEEPIGKSHIAAEPASEEPALDEHTLAAQADAHLHEAPAPTVH